MAGVGADGDLHLGVGFDRSLPALVLGLAGGGAAASVALERLGLDVLERLVDGGDHVGRLGQSDEMSAAALHRDFGDEAVLLDWSG